MQIVVTINKLLLKHGHIYLFTVVCGCFPAARAELSSGDRDHMILKASDMYYLAL